MGSKKKINSSIVTSEAFPGILLLAATILALILANTQLNKYYNYVLYDIRIGEFNLHLIINDFLMAIFFLVVGCEIKRELVYGKLSSIKKASFPVIAAVGGMIVPALIFTLFNFKSGFEIGAGIPLSTDIAFAIGIFCILESRLNFSLKLFLLTLAVVDDLLSIIIIGVFYSEHISFLWIIISLIIIGILFSMRYINKNNKLYPYLIVGFLLWITIFLSGVHSTLSGVILAFCIPVLHEKDRAKDLSYKVQHKLEPFSNFVILPLFAFSNTGIALGGNLNLSKDYPLMLGIIFGLVVGKPLGIMAFTYVSNLIGIAKKPDDATWFDVLEVSILAGIGFTMSLFVSEIAFEDENIELNVAKISVLLAAVISIIIAIILTSIGERVQKEKKD